MSTPAWRLGDHSVGARGEHLEVVLEGVDRRIRLAFLGSHTANTSMMELLWEKPKDLELGARWMQKYNAETRLVGVELESRKQKPWGSKEPNSGPAYLL